MEEAEPTDRFIIAISGWVASGSWKDLEWTGSPQTLAEMLGRKRAHGRGFQGRRGIL